MSRWTRILTLSLLPVAAVAFGSAPIQESAPVHKKKSNPSAEHGATTKPAPGADSSLNPQPIPPGRNKSVVPGLGRKTASKKSVAADGSNAEARDTGAKSARRNSGSAKASGELRDPSSRKPSKTKLNTDGEIRHPSSKKTSATSSRENGSDKGIIFVGGKKTQKTQKTRT